MPFALRLLLAMVAICGLPKQALACKCGFAGVEELRRANVVFVGRALESLDRKICESLRDDNVHDWVALADIGTATRFEVRHSLDLPVGSEALVFTSPFSSCGVAFRVGEEHLVVASRRVGALFADECPYLDERTVEALRSLLGVPRSSLVGKVHHPGPFVPKGCSPPKTLEAAFAAADAVAWTSPRASCTDGTVVEHAAMVSRAWKGATTGGLVVVRVTGHADDGVSDLEFGLDLGDATGHRWPPAEFLRREGERYVNDGCLTPVPPATLEAGVSALTRLLPLSGERLSGLGRCVDVPALSCSKLSQAIFDAPAQRLWDDYRRRRREYAATQKRRPTPSGSSQSPARAGSCAGCAVPGGGPLGSSATVLVLALALFRRRLREALEPSRRQKATPSPTCRDLVCHGPNCLCRG